MMKKWLVPVVAGMGLLLTGCVKGQTQTVDPKIGTVIEKSQQATQKIKSGEAKIVTRTIANQRTISGTISGKFGSNPLVMKVKLANGGSSRIHYYITNRMIYSKPKHQWIKQKVNSKSPIVANLKAQMTAKSGQKGLGMLGHHLKKAKTQANYRLSYHGIGKLGSHTAKQLILAESRNSPAAKQMVNHLKITKFSYLYLVNKTDYLPRKLAITMGYTMGSSKKAVTEKLMGNYQYLNQVKKFTIPKSVKTSAEWASISTPM